MTGTPTYHLDDDADGRFVLDGSALEVAGDLGDPPISYSVTVSVTGVTPPAQPQTFNIIVTEAPPDAPVLTLSNLIVSEGAENAEVIGVLSVENGIGTYVFTVISDPDNMFTIDSANLGKSGELDNTISPSHNVTVQASNGIGTPLTETFTITVEDVDTVAPTLISLVPISGSAGFPIADNLVATFDEPIAFGTGTIRLYDSGDTLIETFDESTVITAGATLTLNPTAPLIEGTSYYILIDDTVITDMVGNSFEGITTVLPWSFTAFETTAPTVASTLPADGALEVLLDATFSATFSETVKLNTGTVNLKKTSDNSLIESWNVVTEPGNMAGMVEVVSGNKLTMHLTSNLSFMTEYYIIWDAGVVEDTSGNDAAVLSSTTAWSFTTRDVVTFNRAAYGESAFGQLAFGG